MTIDQEFRTISSGEAIRVLREAVDGIAAIRDALDLAAAPTTVDRGALSDELRALEEQTSARLLDLGRPPTADGSVSHTMATTVGLPVVTTDSYGAVLRPNLAAAQLFRVPQHGLMRKPLFTYVDGDDRRVARSLLLAALRGESPNDRLVHVRPRQGDPVVCRLSVTVAAPLRTESVRAQPLAHWVIDPEGDGGDQRSAVVDLCRLGVGGRSLRESLGDLLRLVLRGVPGADAASVVLGEPTQPTLLVSSSSAAQAGDGVQHVTGEGPLVEAALRGEWTSTPDLFDDDRWPRLTTSHLGDHTLHSCVAVPLRDDDGAQAGVLVVYGRTVGTLDAPLVAERLRPFLAAAESLVRDGSYLQDIVNVRDQLREALVSRAVIDQAKGMIMMSRGCTADEAFTTLAELSNSTGRKVRLVAEQMVERASTGSGLRSAPRPAPSSRSAHR